MSRSPAARGCGKRRLTIRHKWTEGGSARHAAQALCPHTVASRGSKGDIIFACFRISVAGVSAHGTTVGMIAAAADNADNYGTTGVAPGCKLISAPWNTSDTYVLMNGAIVASRLGMDVMNLSLQIAYESDDYYQVFRDVARQGRFGRGCLFVQIAENYSDDNRANKDFLTTTDLVIGVGGLTLEQDGASLNWKRSCTSGYNVDVFVPDRRAFRVEKTWEWEVFDWMTADPDSGADSKLIDSEFLHYTWVTNETAKYTGTSTSFSAPLVSGILALMLSGNPELTREEATRILFHTCSRPDGNNLLEGIPFDGDVETYCKENFSGAAFPVEITAADRSFSPVTGRSYVYGHGLVNALAAVQAVHRRKNWPGAPRGLFLMPSKPVSGANRYVRVTWQPPELNEFPRDFDGFILVRSAMPLSHPPQDGVLPPSQSWSSDGGVVLQIGTTEREFLDMQQTPTGRRVYSIFYYKVNSLINPVENNYYTYSFGAEARIRFEPSRWKAVTTIGALQAELSVGLSSESTHNLSIVVFADFLSANLSANLTLDANANGSDLDGLVYVVGRSNAYASPATIVRAGGAGTIGMSIAGSTHLVISNFKVQGGEVGMKVADGLGVRSDNVHVYNCRWEGQDVGTWLVNEGKVVFQNNIVVSSGSCATADCAGIFLPDHGTTDDRTFYSILNNTIDVANRPCLRANIRGLAETAHPSTNAQVRLQVFNNVFQAGGTGVCVRIPDYGYTFACNNNCFHRVGGSAVCGRVGSQSFATLASWRPIIYGEKNSIESVPGFVGGGNYHLASAPLSACVNRGTDEIYDTVGAPFDMDGGPRVKAISMAGENARMLFVGHDIGADELSAENVGRAFKRGDANNSGTVDISDQIFITNFLFSEGSAPVCMDAADANDDEMVNISDGIFIVNMLHNPSASGFPKLFSFPEPSPECGFDLVQQSTPGLTCTNPTWCDP